MQSHSNPLTPSMKLVDANLIDYPDVYFTLPYAKLYEEKEQGVAQTVAYQSQFGKVEYTFMKRKVPFLLEGKQYYDVATAYGYGGPHIVETSDSQQLLKQFYEAFNVFCHSNDIVSEFIRFHLFENHDAKLYFPGDTQMIGNHIARDLTKPLEEDFHKSTSYTVRKAVRKGLTVSFDTTGESLPDFLEVFHQTMDRNCANDYYYFREDFFHQMHQELKGNFLYAHATLDGKIIASFMTIVGDRYANGLFGGTLSEYLAYNPATLIWYETFKRLKEEGVEQFVLGGGYRGDDNLYKFKKKFDLQGNHPYFIGKRIHNEEIYQQLVDLRFAQGELDTESSFFPLYRL